ncbi:MAG: DUF2059 domain-containing protein [Massilia sp.]
MKKYIAAFATVLTLASAPVLAQQAAAAATPASAPAAAPVDPAIRAAVRSLFASMKYRDVMQASMQQIVQTLPAQMRNASSQMINNNANLDAAAKQDALAKLDAKIPQMVAAMSKLLTDPTLIDEMLSEIEPLYARNFTLAEINGLAKFYATPLGQKMLGTMPKLMGESMTLGQKIMAPRMGKLMQELTQEIAK